MQGFFCQSWQSDNLQTDCSSWATITFKNAEKSKELIEKLKMQTPCVKHRMWKTSQSASGNSFFPHLHEHSRVLWKSCDLLPPKQQRSRGNDLCHRHLPLIHWLHLSFNVSKTATVNVKTSGPTLNRFWVSFFQPCKKTFHESCKSCAWTL